jgi:uncharacterized coiled-coil protein SlyX
VRQGRITSYTDLEARIEFLEHMVAELNQYITDRRDAIDELRQFLIDEKELII